MSTMKFFISYAHEDDETAQSIAKVCQQLAIPTWLDRKEVQWGGLISESIGRGMKDCTHLVLVLSPASLKSDWVPYEIGRATERGMTILPYLTHKSLDLPPYLGGADRLRIDNLEALRMQVEIFKASIEGLAKDLIQRLARVPAAIQDLPTTDNSKRALSYSANVVLSEQLQTLSEIERGVVAVRGPEMISVYGHFLDEVTHSFRALSCDDLKYWASDDSRDYLSHNARLLQKGRTVERIFVLPARQIPPDQTSAICNQIGLGVRVKIARYERCLEFINQRDLDFGLFDGFAVSFFRFSLGRMYTITTSDPDCRYYRSIYDKVTEVCEQVPGELGPEGRVFRTDRQVHDWLLAKGMSSRVATA
jgi:hypothetical protein